MKRLQLSPASSLILEPVKRNPAMPTPESPRNRRRPMLLRNYKLGMIGVLVVLAWMLTAYWTTGSPIGPRWARWLLLGYLGLSFVTAAVNGVLLLATYRSAWLWSLFTTFVLAYGASLFSDPLGISASVDNLLLLGGVAAFGALHFAVPAAERHGLAMPASAARF